jgi:tyrosine-protein phosphatase SIW14
MQIRSVVNIRLVYRLATIVAMALCAPVVQPQERPDQKKLPNFHQVNNKLYRGAQPKLGELQELANLGIKTVVNLRGKGEGVMKEEEEARSKGLRYFNVPFERAGRPRDADIERVLSIINTPEYQPVFVHCAQGADRTGTVIAAYRIAHDGWTSKDAKAEANRYGMHPWEMGMKNYIHDFYLRHTKQKQSGA